MKPQSAKAHFLKRLASSDLALDALTPLVGIEAMLAFYLDDRADGCELDDDGDMLLFQWGTRDWGDGPTFQVNITRQFIVGDEEDVRQLRLTFEYDSAAGKQLRQGSRWCESPDGISAFRKFVTGSSVMKAVGKKTPRSVELQFAKT